MNGNLIRALSDSELLLNLKNAVLEERKIITQVLDFLREVDRRRLYADSGYASLWDFCTKELGYSTAAASRRISSMRLLRELPELKDALLSGRQNLSSLAQAQKFFRLEEKHQESKLTSTRKRAVLEKLAGKSTRECEQELLKISSVPIELAMPENIRALDETHSELKLVLDSDLLEKLNRIQAIRSHASPSMSYVELLKFMADDVLRRIDPLEKEKAKDEKQKARKNGIKALAKTATESPIPGNSAVRRETPVATTSVPMPEAATNMTSPLGMEAVRAPSPHLPPASEVESVVCSTISKPKSPTRVPIPAAIKRQIWLRDRGKCGFTNPTSRITCGSRHFLEIDHIRPVALGGENTVENLQLRCRAHNQRAAVRIFGPRNE
jgi:hypothetical protein